MRVRNHSIRKTIMAFGLVVLLILPTFGLRLRVVEADTITVPDDHPTIQDAIDNASDGDTIFVRSGTYNESINVNKQLTIQGENRVTTIIDGQGASKVVDAPSARGVRNVIFQGFTIRNGNTGIYFDHVVGSVISDCIAYNCSDGIIVRRSVESIISECVLYNCTWAGVYVEDTDKFDIINCTSHHNYDGIKIKGACKGKIRNSIAYNNSDDGIEILFSNCVKILNCSTYYNLYGLGTGYTDCLSVCNSSFYNNTLYGMAITCSEKLYVSRSSFFNNADDGIYCIITWGSIVSSNFTDNGDEGISSESSNLVLRYCVILNNTGIEVDMAGGTVDARQCWWGNAAGPPSDVDVDGTYSPWQTSLNQPEAVISDLRCYILCVDANSTYYVPTGNIYDDSAFYAFYAFKQNNQTIAAPTQSDASDAYLDENGKPLLDGDIVTFGGRFANRVVRYYEDAGIALVGFENNGTHRIFKRISDGAHIYAVNSSTYNASEKDYLVFQIYTDGNRTIFSIWGIGAQGTYAGGTCFIDIIYENLHEYYYQYCIFSWTDTNGDDMPQPEEIAREAGGII